jgi:hypothetical protein
LKQSQRVPEVWIFEVRIIKLTQLFRSLHAILFRDPFCCHLRISVSVSPHQDESPRDDDTDLYRVCYRTPNGAWNISWRVFRVVDLTATHIADTVSHKRPRRCERALCAAGSIRWYQCPGEKCGYDIRDGDEETAPFTPLDGWIIGKKRHAQKASQRGKAAKKHEIETQILLFGAYEPN